MNWGNKLLVTFIVFGAGMTFLVYRSVKTTYEMADKDYYKNELSYQQVIDGKNRANALSSLVSLRQSDSGILLQLPKEMHGRKISGTVWFYCAYDEKRDQHTELNPAADGSQLLSDKHLAPGEYTVKVDWNSEGKRYYHESNFTVN
ncbi:MAG: FixH family protein [Chitinophagaceae bacterium]|nr:FixH family protein [Chitinophagaceae bacterium]